MSKYRPDYYKLNNDHDLWWFFEHGLLTREEFIGFLRGNIFKYIVRFNGKNGVEDINKAIKYSEKLRDFIAKEKEMSENKKEKANVEIIEFTPKTKKTEKRGKKMFVKGVALTGAIVASIATTKHFLKS